MFFFCGFYCFHLIYCKNLYVTVSFVYANRATPVSLFLTNAVYKAFWVSCFFALKFCFLFATFFCCFCFKLSRSNACRIKSWECLTAHGGVRMSDWWLWSGHAGLGYFKTILNNSYYITYGLLHPKLHLWVFESDWKRKKCRFNRQHLIMGF